MEHITNAINLLGSVIATMDRISVTGIENQNKFVGCAEAVQNASNMLIAHMAEQQIADDEKKEEKDG